MVRGENTIGLGSLTQTSLLTTLIQLFALVTLVTMTSTMGLLVLAATDTVRRITAAPGSRVV